ncbi:MAG: hypothetical protein V3V18_04250 [Methylococcales bacterium]
MSMDLINYVFAAAASGVTGNAAYDSIKLVLGDTFTKLESFAKNDEKETFDLVLQTVLENNKTIKQQLEQLQRGETITIVNQQHQGKGDNVAGNKIIKK